MKQTIMSVIESQRLVVGCGKAALPSGGCVRALYIENQNRALLLTIDAAVSVQAVRTAAALQANLPVENVWVHVTGEKKETPEQAMEAIAAAVRLALDARYPACMSTVRERNFLQHNELDPVLTMLIFTRMDGTPLALLANLACDAARIAEDLERLLPAQMVMMLPSAAKGQCEEEGLAERLAEKVAHAVNPVWTPWVFTATVRIGGEEWGGILYIGRTVLFSLRNRVTLEDAAALRLAFPNDRMLCTAWEKDGIGMDSASLCKEAIAEMKRCVTKAWALPKEYEDAVERKSFDVAYDTQSANQVMDIWLPDTSFEAPYPVIVYAHGGAWAYGWQRGNDAIPALSGLDRGYAVVSIQYRLSGEARFPAALYDIKAVLRWLREQADSYRLDMSRVALWGASAGAWLVSMAAVTAGNSAFEDITHGANAPLAPVPRAVVSWCGPYDLVPAEACTPEEEQQDVQAPFSRFLGAPTSRVPQLCRLASPITHIGKETPPFLLVHGTGDELVPYEQSKKMFAALTGVAGRAPDDRLVLEPGRPHHGDTWYHEPRVCKLCLDYLDQFCK